MISTTLGERQLTVFNDEDFESLINSTLMFDTLLLEIPENSKVYIMANGEKLYLHTDVKDDMKMQDVEGLVIKKGKADVEIGDKVVFHYLSLNNGRDGFGHQIFTFAYKGKLYHLIPCSQIYFSIRDGKYKSHNGRFLVEGIDNGMQVELDGKKVQGKVSEGGIIVVDLKAQLYEQKRCRILCAPSDSEIKEGDIMVTNGVWDVPIKSDVMRGKDKPVYVCEKHNLICSEKFIECTK